ncbi:hypothetical protein LH128_01834 [Sphingomonas sp. LH128]|uniref:hypothetical protein n=1 Tax=Sphingomonas sp. LH128 TaxID=473781 RepID=UPI00027C96C8|nr:hypothetical protein [Sphingomonas sp. LH128]EJU14804.1 hypothetical protein LH128_01834 [Sphingomonas sp. LH128]
MDSLEEMFEATLQLEKVCRELAEGAPVTKERIEIMSRTVRAVGFVLGDPLLAKSVISSTTDRTD